MTARQLIRRALQVIPLLMVVSIVCFAIVHLVPGDPVRTILGPMVDERDIVRLRDLLGLNDPYYVQYFSWIDRAVRGDFGKSIASGLPVSRELALRFPATLQLAAVSVVIGTILGVLGGTAAAIWRGTAIDLVVTVITVAGVSIPIFWLGLVLIMLFSVRLGWLPSIGTGTWSHMVLPAATLAAQPTAIIARMTRSCVLETLDQDYVRTAYSKGLPEHVVILRHVLKNAMIPVITVMGLQFGTLLSGAVITESVFGWPGIGKFTVDAVLQRDYPAIQAAVLLMAALFCLVNLLVDVLYGLVDPRVHY